MARDRIAADAEAALRRFRGFYAELYAIKALLRDGDHAALLGGRATAGPAEDQLTRAAHTRLRDAIAAQGFGGPVPPGAPGGVDPGYVMAAVADEALLHEIEWPGHGLWADAPLEQVLYRSRIAGDRIFEAVGALTQRRAPDPSGVAITILLALQVGFRGRYFGADDRGEIERIRQRLFELVFHARFVGHDDLGGLVAGATEPLAAVKPERLPRARPWVFAIAAAVALYLVVGWVVWLAQVSDTIETAKRVVVSVQGLR